MRKIFRNIAAAVVSLAVLASAAVDLRAEAVAPECEISHVNSLPSNTYTLNSDSEYYLDDNVTLTEEIKITGNVTICLNGNTITAAANSRIFDIQGGSLTICDCAGGGVITGGNVKEHDGSGGSSGGAIYVDNNSTVTLNGGTIKDNSAVQGGGVYVNRGKFIMNGGVISDNNASAGGGVYLHNGDATFEMSKGSISNNTAGHQGGGVYVNGGNGEGGFTMNGGTISGNKVDKSTPDQDKTTYSGGGVYTAGKFTMNGGVISDNISGTEEEYCFGGGVNISGKYALFTMNDGTISDNKGSYGGGVYISTVGRLILNSGALIDNNIASDGGGGVGMGGGEFEMNGGELSHNTSNNGGGVYSNKGTFTVSGGSISDNSSKNGGGVYLTDTAKFTMNSGSMISGNEASRDGGGLYLKNGEFTMNDGSRISDNEAARTGSCVFVSNDNGNGGGTITLNGTVTLTSKPKSDGTKSNVYLQHGKTITIGSGFDITDIIGIHPEDKPDCADHVPATTFAAGVSPADISAKFSADVNGQTVLYNEADAQVKLMGEHVFDMETWGRDPENHWNTCTKCGYQTPHESHRFDGGVITKQPTYTENGVITYTCEDCKWQKTEPIPLIPSNNNNSSNDNNNPNNNNNNNNDDDYNYNYTYNNNNNENSSKNAVPYNPPTGIAVSIAPIVLAGLGIAAAIRRRK